MMWRFAGHDLAFQVLSCLPVVLLLDGCSSPERNRLIIYSPHGKEMLSVFEKAYEAAYPTVDVQWLDMGSQDVYDRIRTERNNPQADVWWGAPSLMFARAEKESLLEHYFPTWDQFVPNEFRSRNGYWYGTFVTPEVIVYNTRVLSEYEAPKDWDDLLDPQWKGRIVVRYPLASGTMRILFCAMIQRALAVTGNADSGFAWLLRLDRNTKSYAADPTQLYLKLAREEGHVTLWNLPDVIIQRTVNGYPFGFRIPASGTPLIVDGIALVRGSKNREEAKRFYEFVTSKEAMIRQAVEFYRIPTRTDIEASKLPKWLNELTLKPMELDWESIAANEQEWMRRWDETVKGRGKHGDEARSKEESRMWLR